MRSSTASLVALLFGIAFLVIAIVGQFLGERGSLYWGPLGISQVWLLDSFIIGRLPE